MDTRTPEGPFPKLSCDLGFLGKFTQQETLGRDEKVGKPLCLATMDSRYHTMSWSSDIFPLAYIVLVTHFLSELPLWKHAHWTILYILPFHQLIYITVLHCLQMKANPYGTIIHIKVLIGFLVFKNLFTSPLDCNILFSLNMLHETCPASPLAHGSFNKINSNPFKGTFKL